MKNPISPPIRSFPRFWETHPVLICMGSGGVGKTTIASTLALQGALSGKRVLALTIDPAKRLADSLGLTSISSTPTSVSLEKLSLFAKEFGISLPAKAALDVVMVDQKTAFDELIFQYAESPSQARRILNDPIYEQISTSLAGAHEYAALATLSKFYEQGTYDLIVLDTPPTIHAVDFLKAPFQLGKLFDSSALKWFMKPYLSGAKWAGLGGALVMKGLSYFVGSLFLEQMGKFLYEFQPILQEFQKRAAHLSSLLQNTKVCFLLICSPNINSVEEALYLTTQLQEHRFSLGAMIVNRVYPERPPVPSFEELMTQILSTKTPQNLPILELELYVKKWLAIYQEQQTIAIMQREQIGKIQKRIQIPLCQIPALAQDVHGLSGLIYISKALQSAY